MNIAPTNDLLIIRRIVNEEPRTASGIILPPGPESEDTPYTGLVLFAGEGRRPKLSGAGQEIVDALQALSDAYKAVIDTTQIAPRGINLMHWQRAADALKRHAELPDRIPMQVKAGDRVIFSRNGHQEFKIDGETVIVCAEASIMGVLE